MSFNGPLKAGFFGFRGLRLFGLQGLMFGVLEGSRVLQFVHFGLKAFVVEGSGVLWVSKACGAL